MTIGELERYLHAQIPLSRAMEITVVRADHDSVVLRAPLAPNINHRETVFGGSASAVAILAAWSLLQTRLLAHTQECRLVIQRNTMEYELPISGTFIARSSIDAESWERLLRTLSRRSKARVQVAAVLEYEDLIAGRLLGEFVALKN